MMNGKVYMTPNPPTPNKGIQFDDTVCTGCNLCVDVCPTDVMMPHPEKHNSPIILYPEECWFCGVCAEECNHGGIIMPLSGQSKDLDELEACRNGRILPVGHEESSSTEPPASLWRETLIS